jgi:uncharacterized protein (DUF302 family)
MLQAHSANPLAEVEVALRRAAERQGAGVHKGIHVAELLQDHDAHPSADAITFTLHHPRLYSMLLASDVRFATLLPIHVAAYVDAEGTKLEAVSLSELVRTLGRAELETLAAEADLETARILEGASARVAATHAGGPHKMHWALGATEDQMNMRGTIGQRIDNRGTRVEELAGTGQMDSPGG